MNGDIERARALAIFEPVVHIAACDITCGIKQPHRSAPVCTCGETLKRYRRVIMGSGTDDAGTFGNGKTLPSGTPPSPPLYPPRKTWPAYFIGIAHAVATRATCNRKHVGCVITRQNRILVTGYNGSIPNAPHCDDVGHDMKDGHCVRTVHAEANAVAQAARSGISLLDATAYVNTFPCWPCMKLLATAGVIIVCYDDDYREDERVRDGAKHAGIAITKFLR